MLTATSSSCPSKVQRLLLRCLPASMHHAHLALASRRGQQHSPQGSLAPTPDVRQVHPRSRRQQKTCCQVLAGAGVLVGAVCAYCLSL